jgi:hypothetical protein
MSEVLIDLMRKLLKLPLQISNKKEMKMKKVLKQITVESPCNVPQFKVPSYKLIFNDPKSTILMTNNLHLKFSSILCSNPLICREPLNGGFTVMASGTNWQ